MGKNTLSMEAAENQLQGKLHQIITHFQKKLTDIGAILEAWVDFPEEGLEFSTKELAIEYANKNKIEFEIIVPKERKIIKKSYADNFTK